MDTTDFEYPLSVTEKEESVDAKNEKNNVDLETLEVALSLLDMFDQTHDSDVGSSTPEDSIA